MIPAVSRHAIERYQERVANVPEDLAVAALQSRAVQVADEFGAEIVRLGTGQRVILKNHVVITVLPTDHWPASLDRRRIIDSRHPQTGSDN